MNYTRTAISIILSTIIAFAVLADDLNSIKRNLEYQTFIYPQEKVYVAMDRNVYFAGDTIRLRAFLVDALTLTQNKEGSEYVYVEIKNPFGESVQKIKIRKKDAAFTGVIPLSEELPEGTYTLVGYTLFMKNQGVDYIFTKPLPIKSQLAKKYRLHTSFEENKLVTSLSRRTGIIPEKAINIALWSKEGLIREGVHRRSSFDFTLSPKILKQNVLKIKYDRYEKFVRITSDTTSVSVSFHPEGGYLIPNIQNRIALKALDINGLGKDIKGHVINSKGEECARFATEHRGMGIFQMIPTQGESYTAVINGKSYLLPSPNRNAAVLNINTGNLDSISISVKGAFKPGQILISNNCGIVTYADILHVSELKIAREGLGSGLVQFYLIDANRNILSSRLIFNHKGYLYLNSSESEDPAISLPPGDYTVTSRKTGKDSIFSQSIVSELMLASDLNGHIEDPDYYFSNVDDIRNRHLDALLLTQGWKRYDVQNAIKGIFQQPEEPMEIGGEIRGTVNSRWRGKPLEGAVVNAIAPQIDYVGVAQTDSLGRFALNGADWPDGTFFAVQAFNKNGNREHNLEFDKDEYPIVTSLPEQYNADAIADYRFDNGAVWLEELEVTAKRSDEELREEMLKALGVKMVTSEEIENNNITSYDEIIYKIPGLRISNGNLIHIGGRTTREGTSLVELWVDGVQWLPFMNQDKGNGVFNTFQEFSQAYPIHIMENILYFRSSVAMIISRTAALGAGALVFTTKSGKKLTNWDHTLFIKRITPLGYQQEAEAYNPHFEYDPTNEDAVPTSFWFPSVKDGTSLKQFEKKRMTIEGITDKGLPFFGIFNNKE